jgi:hypothetical protein
MANRNGNAEGIRIVDGQLEWSGGIDSGRIPTIASDGYPTGLKRNQLAWVTNGTVRGGGISQRTGWRPLVRNVPWLGIFQGASIYEPPFANPYIIAAIGGRIYQIRVDTDNSVVDLTAAFPGTDMPPDEPHYFFVQGEEFLIIQAGDLKTLPLFWDGNILRRSVGFLGIGNLGNELPAAASMDYYMGRLWYAFGRQYVAGDIVGNQSSGTIAYQFRDSILKNTENPVSLSGDGFIVPTSAGNIRSLKHSANLNTALGQGQLYVFTRKSVYATDVPPTRTEWANLKEPLQRVAQIDYGAVSDRCVVPVNGDMFYQSIDGVRALALAIRYFDQWGNVPISRPEQRVLRFNDRALLRFASGMNFDNRLWQTCVPFQTPKGVAHQGVMLLDFDILGSFGDKQPPVWEGIYEGLYFLQLLEGDFGGLSRGFSFVVSKLTGNIDLFEMTTQDRFDSQVQNDGDRVTWYLETPAYTWGDPFMLKQLDGLELWFDKMLGTVNWMAEYRPDSSQCWIPWHTWKQCVAKDCNEDPEAVTCPAYPVQPYCEGYRATVRLPRPPTQCEFNNARPTTQGYQFQIRITIKGWCRLRGLRAFAFPLADAPYMGLVCASSDFSEAPPPPSSTPLPANTPTSPTSPATSIGWEAASAMVFWEDNALNPFSGNLAFFQANANLADMASFNIISEGITSISGLDTLVDVETIFLDNNALTSIPALPDTGHLLTFSAASNQITSIASFTGTIQTLAIGGNPGLASIPALPAPLSFFDFSLTGFNAVGVNSLLGQLVAAGLNNGTVAMVSMDTSASAANIATLSGRGWTIIT